ncbi:MAG: DNA polymerase I, partial [Planctomycetota bacterium]|nr:DNA polymerase I [Planctomycetota bacterium]
MPDALTASKSPRLFLLDGMALAYRAHFAFIRSPLTNSQGVETSAVYGFLMALDRILDQEDPEEIAVVFDPLGPTFRHERYPDYKATREKMPDEMIPQLDWIKRAVEGLGIAFVCIDGYEADDVIGTLAVEGAAAGKDVWIVSGDKDMMQLVGEKVRLYNVLKPGQNAVELVGADETVAKFGVPPEKVIDVMGLMGDSSDNVPGVPGVGPKRALTLIEAYGTLESVLEHAPEVKQKKLSENLQTFAEQARLSKELVTIDTEVPLEAAKLDLGRSGVDVDTMRGLYVELDFKGRLERLEGGDETDPLGDVEYVLVDTPKKVDELAKTLAFTKRLGGFVFDTETTSVDAHQAELVGLSFSWFPGVAWYVPVNLEPPMYGGEAELKQQEGSLFAEPGEGADVQPVLDALRGPLEDPEIPKCGQNMKYDIHVLRRYGVEVQGAFFDTMVASFCLDPGSRIHNLDGLALSRLGIKKIPTSDLIGKGKNEITMREVEVEKVSHYACEDADVTLRLRDVFAPELEEMKVERVFQEAEMPLLPVLVRMEANGIRLDVDLLQSISADLGERIEATEARIHELAGREFNIRSTQTLGAILFEELELHLAAGRKRPKRTSKGTGYATDEATLRDLQPFHELPGLVLGYRHMSKLKSTYVDTLPTYVHPETKRIHTSFHQTGAATGRLSSSDPNLQNIPIRSAEGRAIRKAFVPEDGWRFLSCDYSQIELRLLAHFSEDPGLLEAFRSGEDVHRATAARVFKV